MGLTAKLTVPAGNSVTPIGANVLNPRMKTLISMLEPSSLRSYSRGNGVLRKFYLEMILPIFEF